MATAMMRIMMGTMMLMTIPVAIGTVTTTSPAVPRDGGIMMMMRRIVMMMMMMT